MSVLTCLLIGTESLLDMTVENYNKGTVKRSLTMKDIVDRCFPLSTGYFLLKQIYSTDTYFNIKITRE